MAEENPKNMDIFSKDDPLDINELAALNDDISLEFIEQLQKQVSENAGIKYTEPSVDDVTEIFEEVDNKEVKKAPTLNVDIDDNFIKKYKARLNKQKVQIEAETQKKQEANEHNSKEAEPPKEVVIQTPQEEIQPETTLEVSNEVVQKTEDKPQASDKTEVKPISEKDKIENLSNGNIIETPFEKSQVDNINYNLNPSDYTKYVIYVNKENTNFIESLTVKERKNLINRILREQDDIAINKRRLNMVLSTIKHLIVAIITISISIPIVYYVINTSLEASINNYRRSQSIFKTLYKEKGKIKTKSNY